MTDVRDVRGTSVNIPTQDGSADAYLAHPDDNTAHPAVLFYVTPPPSEGGGFSLCGLGFATDQPGP
ncbi:hypothetical protein ACGFZ9_29230 [Streptomyces mirabilis]|uniref:hypothetical protein n=1 Tax=Streptomyces mirabilis TaxID=68239 RepID=UPI0037154365